MPGCGLKLSPGLTLIGLIAVVRLVTGCIADLSCKGLSLPSVAKDWLAKAYVWSISRIEEAMRF